MTRPLLYRVFFLVLMTAAVALALSACSTMKGLGQDISKAGDALSGAAD